MKSTLNFYPLLATALFAVCIGTITAGCSARAMNPNRLYFFENEDRAIIVPVTINDSIVLENALFDTGAPRGFLQLDSTFCATHSLTNDPTVGRMDGFSALTGWAREGDPKYHYTWHDSPLTVEMCGADMEFDFFQTIDNSIRNGKFDACFSFSNEDRHVWELNFKHNYMEAHDAADFVMPDDCYVVPIVDGSLYNLYVKFPVKVTCADGATITIDQTYLIDTGALVDLVLFESAAEYDFFRRRDDVVLLERYNNRRYEVDAEVFDGVKLDAMRVYLNEGSQALDSYTKGLIGLNFLKRFNVFIDLSENRVGFQPIKGFKRTVNVDYKRLYILKTRDTEGNDLVTEVLDIPGNPYKEAGVMAGDIVVAVNGIEVKNVNVDDRRAINRAKTQELDIIRGGEPIHLTVRFDELGE